MTATFAGGGHNYISAVRFHVVPGHRLYHADLQRLDPGTMRPAPAPTSTTCHQLHRHQGPRRGD
uniref:Uncharacterized protein n=1 Tax=Leersia perrieri TaxID=77586 RepID=A0A0D9WAV4_9ORYZ